MRADLFHPAGSIAAAGEPVHLTPADADWSFSGLRVLALGPGERRVVRLEGIEACVLPLSGSCAVEVGAATYDLEGRPDVFARVSDFAYLPAGAEMVISSDAGCEIALPNAPATRALDPAYVPAEAVSVEIRGGGPATRQINNFLAVDAFEAERLIAVEVLTPAGNWSSFPPHKHDEHTQDEVPLEEIYYFRIRGEHGFGFHRTYTIDDTIDETVTVRDGDVFLIPRGYHGPCVAAPGHTMYYLNVMAGPAERAWRVCLDPAHERLGELLGSLAPDPRCPLVTADGPREVERS